LGTEIFRIGRPEGSRVVVAVWVSEILVPVSSFGEAYVTKYERVDVALGR
jgi:hypothetical protein